MQGDKQGGARPSLIGAAAGGPTLQPGAPQRARVLDDLSGQTTGARASQRMRQAGVTLAVALAIALAWMGWQRQRAAPAALPLDEAAMAGHAVIAANPSDALHGVAAPAVAQVPATAAARIVDAEAVPRAAPAVGADAAAVALVASAAASQAARSGAAAVPKAIATKRTDVQASSKRDASRRVKSAAKPTSRGASRAVAARTDKSRGKGPRVATKAARDPDSDLLAALLKRSDAPAR